MATKKIIIGILIVIVAGIGYYGYTDTAGEKPEPQSSGQATASSTASAGTALRSTANNAPITKETVKIGVIVPLTGAQAAYGQGIKEGLDLSADGINNTPRFGIHINLIYEDTESDIKNAPSAARKLTSKDHVVALITSLSPISLSVAPIAEETKTVLLTMASLSAKLNTAGPYVFKTDDIGKGLGTALADEAIRRGFKSAATLFAQYNDGVTEYHDSFIKEFKAKGGTITGTEGFNNDMTDFRTALQKLLAHPPAGGPAAIAIMGLQRDCALAARQVRELGYKGQLLGSLCYDDPTVVEAAGAAVEGVVMTSFNGEPSAQFTELTKNKYGHEPLRWSVEAFDGLRLLALGLSRAESGNPPAGGPVTGYSLQGALAEITSYKGEAGTVTFDKDGNARRALHVKEVKDGKIVEVK